MLTDGQGTKWRRKIADNFKRQSRVHERYKQTDDRRTGDSIANVNLSSRSLKTVSNGCNANRLISLRRSLHQRRLISGIDGSPQL